MAYEDLVKRVDANWDNDHNSFINKYPVKNEIECSRTPRGQVVWDWEKDIHEINLWNYWQGNTTHKADIMLVGQDWGNPCGADSEKIRDNILGEKHYLNGIDKPCPTDKNLIELFKVLKKDGKPLFKDIQNEKYDNLFFTNFFLGYRRGKGSGGMRKSRMMLDAPYFKELADIVDPKIIIALGKDTYECVVAALKGTQNYVADEFMVNLNRNKMNTADVQINGHNVVVVGVVHCGSYGVNINRRRKNKKDGLDLMKDDWQNINQFIDKYL